MYSAGNQLTRCLAFLRTRPLRQVIALAIAMLLDQKLKGIFLYRTILYLAGLQGVPVHYYEAAEVDGATPFTLIPRYIIFQRLGWIDSMKPLIVPAWFGSAFDIFLLRQFFLTIPRELDEAAILDGCDFFSILWRIVLPLAKLAIVTVIAFSIVAMWNDFMGPLIYLNSTEKVTVAVGLSLFRRMSGDAGFTDLGQVMAASVMSQVPMLVLFITAQRYFDGYRDDGPEGRLRAGNCC